jgi:glycosyltransferase involved in cell wall biosynthesis
MDTHKIKGLAIVTPAKNESGNVPELVRSVANQTVFPDLWVFVNDSSTDDTEAKFGEEVLKYPHLCSNCTILVIKHTCTDNTYALGTKYSRVVRFGFDELLKYEHQHNVRFDFLGILDSDVFPSPGYYENLLQRFKADSTLGIAAGGRQEEFGLNGNSFTSISVATHAPGNSRVWRRECFEATGYYISISQDSVSEARAVMMGWKVRSFPYLSVRMRKKGGNYSYRYYGVSDYVRWTPMWYTFLKSLKIFLSGRRSDAGQFLKGYMGSRKEKLPRLDDPLSKKYYRYRLYYKITGR